MTAVSRVVDAMRTLFEELDLDGNGLVTHRELLTALTANGWAPEIQLYTKPSLPFVGRSTAHDSYPQHRNQSRRPYQAAAPAAEACGGTIARRKPSLAASRSRSDG